MVDGPHFRLHMEGPRQNEVHRVTELLLKQTSILANACIMERGESNYH